MEKADLVLFEQVQDAVVVLLDDVVLARHHLGHIHAQALDRVMPWSAKWWLACS
jgi:hypothetical protein